VVVNAARQEFSRRNSPRGMASKSSRLWLSVFADPPCRSFGPFLYPSRLLRIWWRYSILPGRRTTTGIPLVRQPSEEPYLSSGSAVLLSGKIETAGQKMIAAYPNVGMPLPHKAAHQQSGCCEQYHGYGAGTTL
jgi:hypothetical protein